MAWSIFINNLIGGCGADRRKTADMHYSFNLFPVLYTASVKRNAYPCIVMEVIMPVAGTGDAQLFCKLIANECKHQSFGLAKKGGLT